MPDPEPTGFPPPAIEVADSTAPTDPGAAPPTL